MFDKITIIGVGLMGGSLALAAKQAGLAGTVVGCGRSADRLRESLQLGQIDSYETEISAGVADAELVVVGVPVQLVAETVAEVRRHCPPNCIITDLGSTKRQIVAAAANQQGYGHFVGCHPLAGDHRSGCQFARADLFADRLVVLTPTPHTDQRAADRLEHFWRVVGSRVQCMSPDQHDHLLALASHVPHLASTAVAATTPREALDFVASGWLDTTRVAAGHVEMWRQIVDTNRQPILAGLDLLVANLQAIRDAVATGDDARLADLLAQGKQIRDAVGN